MNSPRGNKATGIEYIDGSTGQRTVAKASRLVVLSAGTFGSPTILQRQVSPKYNSGVLTVLSRSGIGNADLLKKHEIEILTDLPGVGEHYIGTSSLPHASWRAYIIFQTTIPASRHTWLAMTLIQWMLFFEEMKR